MTTTQRKRQKKLEKHKKKRELARRQARSSQVSPSLAGLVRRAAQAPFGPAWVTEDIGDIAMPALVSVMVTRKLANGLLLAQLALVDRTCLGVKNACVWEPAPEFELVTRVRELGDQMGAFAKCDPLFAQSIVFSAIDYARTLGFEPHRDFEPALFEPRPTALIDTPLARPEQPFYASGPHDDYACILQRLDAAVGPGNYQFVLADDDEEEEWFDDDADALDPA